ncbi:uncharacterized protein LOC130743756 [Lotus japonicus]|uniref:uncharacterized protein LOC130743756 n=1 Tax=Lotus japonicus TaxID=34305 RepID=UPI0025858BC8|nr:uncharacterized protein LOC130743756 [Lotus japonicus]
MNYLFFEVHDRAAQVLRQLPNSRKVSVFDDFLKRNWRQTIEQIKDLSEKTICIVLTTIKIFTEGYERWYPACKCTKKVYPADGMYFCESCNRHVLSTTPRFKLQAHVMDEKNTTTFVIFDQEASAVLNTSCADLVDASSKNPGDSMLPPEIMTLIDWTFLFKIEVDNRANSRFQPSYRMKKICVDHEIISNLLAANPPAAAGPYLLLTTPISNENVASSSSDLATAS